MLNIQKGCSCKFIKILLYIFAITLLSANSFAQQSMDSILNYTLSYRGLTRNDITIPINFDKDKSPTNDSKLLLPIVRDLMKNPLQSFGFMDNVMEFKNLNLIALLEQIYKLKNYNSILPYDSIINIKENGYEELGELLISFAKERRLSSQKLTGNFNNGEKQFLQKNIFSIIGKTDSDDNNNMDIFKFNRARDSATEISKKTMDILSKDKIRNGSNERIGDAEYCFAMYEYLKSKLKYFSNDDEEEFNNEHVQGKFLYYHDQDGIRIAIGGGGKNVYNGHFDFIIDIGGDDIYNINRETDDIFKNNFSCIMDFSGNDYYSAGSDYCLAGSIFSSGLIFDKEGDDTYKGRNVSLGSSICGLGILYDENGNDTYQADQFSIGAASFGIGLLADRAGNDVYIANSYSEGFGMTEGVGVIVDNKGNDNYLIDARSLDIGRYEDHYVSMCQGYGLGLRPYYAGGIGLIIEGEGNDFYSTDIFGQGGAYWYGLGCIVDKSGHDKYNSYQYAQGAGIHLAVGLLKDYDGWDFYSSDGVSQGCGHDFGFGLLYDAKGNDNYSAYSLSQGAGNANGIGMFIDESGRDGYLNKEPDNTRGYGNSRREYGSLGIFLDASGEDFYSIGGMDSVISNASMWGVMNDYYLQDLPAQFSGNTFKIPLDSSKNYLPEDYFVMAKTIEPRFSLWQDYGFKKLVEDSINTSEYVLKYLDTEDNRAGLVLRNLAFKIGYTFGNLLKEKLRLYNLSMRAQPLFNQNQIAFICYLFGETRNPAGKEELLNLTYDENIRIRSASVNALGKITADTSDTEFINQVSKRLRELATENSGYKLYNKDIAYAFKNYKNLDNIAVLIQLMKYDYFGVRFPAAEALKAYGEEYYKYINGDLLNTISSERTWYQAFLNSISELPENDFKELFNKLLNLEISKDEIVNMNYIDLLKNKSSLSKNNDFKVWSGNLISGLQFKSILKVK